MSGGCFMVSRQIWDHPEFRPAVFSEREAFMWLVSEAAWKSRTTRAGRAVVDLERGQLCASLRFLSTAWGWSKSRVERFLKRLENRDMIRAETGTGQVVITVCNYSKYQGERDTGGTEAGHGRDRSGTNENKGNKDNNTPKPPNGVPDGFDAFWSAVPKKVGKDAAIKAYRAAVKKAPPELILSGIKAYAVSVLGKDRQYVANPASWLNAGRWGDEVDAPRGWRDKPEAEWTAKDRLEYTRAML